MSRQLSHSNIYAVVGNPVEHSLSPRIHTLFAQATGQEIHYGRLRSPLDGFSQCIADFAASGAHGANVTVPFKFEALKLATHATPRAQLAGAANTLRFDATLPDKSWQADNTDGTGLVHDITHNAGILLRGQHVLLIGAGGASSGVLGPLIEACPERITVANRSLHKAQALIARHSALAQTHEVELKATNLQDCGNSYHVVINGTSSSLEGAGVPVSATVLRPGAMALDMMYGPAAQPFLSWAQSHQVCGRDGLGMLVEQAAESFLFWRGVRPEGAPVLEQLRKEAHA
jgi:shikimate dehydrogenase